VIYFKRADSKWARWLFHSQPLMYCLVNEISTIERNLPYAFACSRATRKFVIATAVASRAVHIPPLHMRDVQSTLLRPGPWPLLHRLPSGYL
jgi:hypothetical protein